MANEADELAEIRAISDGKARQMRWESEHGGDLILAWREGSAIFVEVEGGVDSQFNRVDFTRVLLSRQAAHEIEMALRAFRKSGSK